MEHEALRYIALGDYLATMREAKTDETAFDFAERIRRELAGLELNAAIAQANSLEVWKRHYEGRINDPKRFQKPELSPGLLQSIQYQVAAIWNALNDEAAKRKVLVLNPSPVAEKLRAMNFKDPHLRPIAEETIACLRANLPRSAFVMGWNLTFEYLRLWILAKHLQEFNRELTTRNRTKTEKYDAIVAHDDFLPLGESFVLEVAFAAGFLPKMKLQVLTGALNRRNHFAHPNFEKANDASAAGQIMDLIVNILDDPTFAM